MMKYSLQPLVLDDYELVEGSIGLKELKQIRVPFYIISTNKISSLDCITCYYEFPGVPVEDFARVQNISIECARDLLQKSNGNMHTVKLDLDNFKSERDVFVSSREYVQDIISKKAPLSSFLEKHLSEHGNTFGIIHENYPDFSSDSLHHVTQSLSDADLIDRAIYTDMSWELMPYFNTCACLLTASHFSDASSSSLRPASIWTKTSNMLMKRNRLKKLQGIHRDSIPLYVQKMNTGGDAPPQFSSYDLDSLNQLSFTKIKPKILTLLKKKCHHPKE
jgi:hypothetical protein